MEDTPTPEPTRPSPFRQPPTPTPEPVAISGAIMAVTTAGFGLAVLLGLPLTPEQVGACVGFIGAVIALVTIWQRSRVTPWPRPRRSRLD